MRRISVIFCCFVSGSMLPASPYTDYQKISDGCSNTEFKDILGKWLQYTGDYEHGLAWIRNCRQQPETALPLVRKLKQQVFKFENPPDIEGYLKLMEASRVKSRVARAWNVYSYLRSDKRVYSPEDKMKLSAIPTALEEIALAKVEDSHRSLCNVELDEDSVADNSRVESNFWAQIATVKGRKDLTATDHKLLDQIDACLAKLYGDPSIGRGINIYVPGTGFPEWSVEDAKVTPRLQRYVDICAHAVRNVGASNTHFVRPGPLDAEILTATRTMRDDCDDELFRRAMEEEKEFPLLPAPFSSEEHSR